MCWGTWKIMARHKERRERKKERERDNGIDNFSKYEKKQKGKWQSLGSVVATNVTG